MASLDVQQVLNDMLAAGETSAADKWADIRDFAESEGKKLLATAAQIESRHRGGGISDDEAGMLLELQANSARTSIMAIEGMTALAAEAAVNAMVDVLRTALNTLLGSAIKMI